MSSKFSIIPAELIERSILLIRGHKIMLDKDLARLYEVSTKVFNQAVKRNIKRFPPDFMFQLTMNEAKSLRSQFVTLNDTGLKRGKHSKYLSYAFTEQGVAMLSSVLNSERAILVNIEIMRTFARLRQLLSTHKELAKKLEVLEKKYDVQFRVVFDAIRQLMEPPEKETKRPRIGFHRTK
ncbi:MAG: ORF6N domain-containing protein [Planctomycetota bacterium]